MDTKSIYAGKIIQSHDFNSLQKEVLALAHGLGIDKNWQWENDKKTWEQITAMRKALTTLPSHLFLQKFPHGKIIGPVGFRINHVGGYSAKTKNAYSVHRDTWYGLPQHAINVWVSMFGAEENNTFDIFTDYFAKPIANTSSEFNPHLWKSSPETAVYPEACEDPQGSKISFSLEDGEAVLFSSHHLHQMRKDPVGTRMSIDFRIVFDGDEDKGPENIDNGSLDN